MAKFTDKKELEQYTGSIVLGLNDALIELTGALTGLTFAFENTRLISVVGLLTGTAAALSMAASEYLSTKEEGGRDALRSALYTGIAYIITVILLITPFFLLQEHFTALLVTLPIALSIIYVFNIYIISPSSKTHGKRKFVEMAAISMGAALINFLFAWMIRRYLNIQL